MPLGSEETMQCGLKIVWSKVGIIAASKYTEPKKKKSLQDHTKINSCGEKNNAQVPMSIWHQISTWQGLKRKKCFMLKTQKLKRVKNRLL